LYWKSGFEGIKSLWPSFHLGQFSRFSKFWAIG
jgi:hypothetical protein